MQIVDLHERTFLESARVEMQTERDEGFEIWKEIGGLVDKILHYEFHKGAFNAGKEADRVERAEHNLVDDAPNGEGQCGHVPHVEVE